MSEVPHSRIARRQGLKTLVLWLIIIAMFVAIYAMLTPHRGQKTFTSAGVAIGVLVAILLIAFAGYFVAFRRQGRRFVRETTEALASIGRGDLSKARQTFWRWAENTQMPRVSAIARHNLGWTMLRQGELQNAIDVLTDNDTRFRSHLKVMGLSPTSAVDIALGYALIGNAEMAAKWLAHVEDRTKEMSLPSVPALKAFVRAVLDCRADRAAEAAHLLDENWAAYEAALTGDVLRPLRILRAFATAAAGPRNAGMAETLIAMSRPAYPGEYDFLAVAWPAMATFLASHEL